jgi:membrane-associated phospholipid phosphatase
MKLVGVLRAIGLGGQAVSIGRYSATPEGREVDRELFGRLNRRRGSGADRYLFGITELGSLYAAGSAAAVLALAGRRREAARAAAAAGATWLLLQGAKKLVNRARPYEADPDGTRRMIAAPRGSSWPSSHPAVLTTFTRVTARELGLGALPRGVLTVLDLSVAASRVCLGVHYPSDVLSGLLLGRAVAHAWPRVGA